MGYDIRLSLSNKKLLLNLQADTLQNIQNQNQGTFDKTEFYIVEAPANMFERAGEKCFVNYLFLNQLVGMVEVCSSILIASLMKGGRIMTIQSLAMLIASIGLYFIFRNINKNNILFEHAFMWIVIDLTNIFCYFLSVYPNRWHIYCIWFDIKFSFISSDLFFS